MSTLQKGILWITGCIVFVFFLSIALAWETFGFIDVRTAMLMGAMLLPIIATSCLVIVCSERPAKRAEATALVRRERKTHVPEEVGTAGRR